MERDVDICFFAFSDSGGTVAGKLAAGYRILKDRKEFGFVVAASEKAVVELFDGSSAVAEFGCEAKNVDDHTNNKASEDTRRVSRVRRQVELYVERLFIQFCNDAVGSNFLVQVHKIDGHRPFSKFPIELTVGVDGGFEGHPVGSVNFGSSCVCQRPSQLSRYRT